MRKNLSFLIFLSIILFTLYQIFKIDIKRAVSEFLTFSYCETPVLYKIGNIDPKFQLSKAQIEEFTKEAANIWNQTSNATSKHFILDPNAVLSINLVYDQRYDLLKKIKTVEDVIQTKKLELDENLQNYEELKDDLEKKIEEFKEEVAYVSQNKALSKETYNKLMETQASLQKQVEDLNSYAQNLNQNVEDVNFQISDFNGDVSDLNNILTIKQEGGIYFPAENKIEIYLFENDTELIHILAHELGHARGLDHVAKNTSVMSTVTNDQVILSDLDEMSLNNYCKEKNLIDSVKNKNVFDIKYFFENNFSKKLNY